VPGRWFKRGEGNRADKQQGDPRALNIEGDPHGGAQSDEYRYADPRDVVEEDWVVMSVPAERRRKAPRPRSDASANAATSPLTVS
jgi:hypothetical protein